MEVALVETPDPAGALDGFAALAAVRHPRLQMLVEWGRADARCAVVSERARGRDLAEVAARADLPLAQDVASWGAQAADAVAALHERGLVHGGLCPVLLVLDDDGDVMVTGAGLATAAGPVELGDGDPPQNAFYVTPEEVLATPLTPASDVYALGAALYRLATGRPPFAGPDALTVARQHVNATPPAPRAIRPDLPAALDHILRRALHKDPRKRPSAALMSAELAKAALGARVAAPSVPEGPGPAPPRPWWPWVLGLALITLLAGVLWGAGVFAERVSVPDVTGLTADEARATLVAVGLSPGQVTTRVDPQHEGAGTVLSQRPAPGTRIREGVSVDLVVVEGLAMPDVRGLAEADARAALQAAGFAIDRLLTAPSATVPAGQVVSQSPPPGAPARPGTTFVTLVVSTGPVDSSSPSPATP